jgi:hypothetical protein
LIFHIARNDQIAFAKALIDPPALTVKLPAAKRRHAAKVRKWPPAHGRIRIIKHEAVPICGSYEVRFSDGRKPEYFYWDDVPDRRMRPELFTSEQALEKAKAFARAERDKG